MKKIKIILAFSLLINTLLIGVGSLAGYKQGGMRFLKEQMKAMVSSQEFPDSYLQKKNLFESLDYGEVDKIFVGDSITDHGEFQQHFPDEVVLNRGIVDDDTKGVLNRIDEVIKRNPKEVYIMIGINDIGNKTELDEYKKNMEEIVQNFDGTSIKVTIQSILPINNQAFKNELSNKRVMDFNQVLKKIAEENEIQYIDLNPVFQDSNGQLRKEYTVDGIHLSGNGYDAWMNQMK
jgi:lysophospholipase L1-like esterase